VTQIFDQEVPLTESDVVVFYVSVVGTEAGGGLKQRSFIKKMHGDTIHGRKLNAIQLTTAAGMVGVLELFAKKKLGPRLRAAGIRLARKLPLHPVGRPRVRQMNF
jgi:saccharopine dehydrogenase-like NADP-dependent oxidoreductase